MARRQTNLIARLLPRMEAESAHQVAAVCYRQSDSGLEFLLVRTNRGRWTFPKGAIDQRLGAVKSAEREAWEEAGALGRMAEEPFHSYIGSKKQFCRVPQEFLVLAYLLEVTALENPQESYRHPTWASAQEASAMLAEGREAKYASEFNEVIERALDLIQNRSRSLAPRQRQLSQDAVPKAAQGALEEPAWTDSVVQIRSVPAKDERSNG